MASMMEGLKRKPFTETEKIILTEIMKKYPIITNPKTDAATNRQKSAAWDSIGKELNASTLVIAQVNIALLSCACMPNILAQKR